jgi:hypothetical protein
MFDVPPSPNFELPSPPLPSLPRNRHLRLLHRRLLLWIFGRKLIQQRLRLIRPPRLCHHLREASDRLRVARKYPNRVAASLSSAANSSPKPSQRSFGLLRVNLWNSCLNTRREPRPKTGGARVLTSRFERPPHPRTPLMEHEPHSQQRHDAGKSRPLDAAPNGLPLPAKRQNSD